MLKNIRNFAIIAHIDHGKSTLADRLIEICGGLSEREMVKQVLDSLVIERKRGITIKAQTVRLTYQYADETYHLNLIDTPGHVDFSYEVSRSLAACEGSILLVDATQGVEAQTIANVYKALESDHEIIPVLNKIDLPSADPNTVKHEIEEIIGLSTQNVVEISAKHGTNIHALLAALIKHLPPPKGDAEASLQALLIDSWYDKYLGVIILVRVYNGQIYKGMSITTQSNKAVYQVENIGIFTPKKYLVESLSAGEIGFITAGIKTVSDCKVGDTITAANNPGQTILAGFQESKPVVFCGLFPLDISDFVHLKNSLQKLHLNDASFTFQPTSLAALGHGFHCGFLGMLHLEVVQERLREEFSLELIVTAPSVSYKAYTLNGEIQWLHSAAEEIDFAAFKHVEEPWVKATIIVPHEYLGKTLNLCSEKRGEQIEINNTSNRAVLHYYLPLAEIVFDFYDKLKSLSRGYASFDWEITAYRVSLVVQLNILINGKQVSALSSLIHKDRAESYGRALCQRLKELIPRQQYKIALQAAIGGKIIARETISPYRKDVTAKLYGGDVTRRMKLLEKQKKGKKRMYQVGDIALSQNVFIQALKVNK